VKPRKQMAISFTPTKSIDRRGGSKRGLKKLLTAASNGRRKGFDWTTPSIYAQA